jgi:hypothetical protein
MRDLLNNSAQFALLSALKRTADATGTAVNLAGEGRKLLVILSVGAVDTSSLTLTIQESANNSTFSTLYAFAVKTAAGTTVVNLAPTMKYVRAIATLGSTNTYSVSFGVIGIAYHERYQPDNIA